jgi:HAD superfamily hydrolase (TIGR01509 family)
MIKAIIFDWNGVIINDLDAQAKANCDIIETLEGKKITPEIWFKEITQDWKLFFMEYGVKKADIPKVIPLMNEYYPKYFDLVKIEKNTKHILEKLKDKGILMGILSGTNKKSILDNIKRFFLEGIFSFVISGEDVKNSKPHPEGLLMAIKKCGVPANEIVYVDDMPTMFSEAKKLGLATVGFESKLKRNLSEADFVIEDISEILNIIKLKIK